jgi:hypothetical protein
MARPPLPTDPRDTWSPTFWKTPSQYVGALSSGGGRIVAGGEQLYLLRAGNQNLAVRDLGADMGPILAVAVEPRPPWRIAVAHELGGVHILVGDAWIKIRRAKPADTTLATHVAWGTNPTALCVRWEDGEFARFSGNRLQTLDSFESLDPVDGLAADDRGVVALVRLEGPTPIAGTLRGNKFDFRLLPIECDEPRDVHVAVAGDAIAVALDDSGAWLSRSQDEAFAACAPLATACTIAFEGTATDAALFGAVTFSSTRSFVRVDASGAAVRVADIEAEGSDEPANVSALAWDASRKTLWAASTTVGLIAIKAPGAKGMGAPS